MDTFTNNSTTKSITTYNSSNFTKRTKAHQEGRRNSITTNRGTRNTFNKNTKINDLMNQNGSKRSLTNKDNNKTSRGAA